MPLVLKDRVQETTTTTGTGTVTLAGAVVGFQSFSVIGDGNTTYYTITSPTDFEVGIGTFTAAGTLLSRDTILESSNSGNAVDFTAGIKTVFITYPADKSSVTFSAGSRTANYTASSNEGVLTDTSAGAFTVTLPANPLAGAVVVVADSGSSWGTNNLTIARNGETIGGLAEDLVCNITGASVNLIYDGASWEVYAQVGGNGGTAVTLDGTQTLTNKTINIANNTLTGVQPTLVSGTNIKTLNGGSLLGSGDIALSSVVQYPQNSKSADYTLVLGDAGKQIFHPASDTSQRTFTIPANSSVAYPIGTVLLFTVEKGGRTVIVSITSDTLVFGNGTTGNIPVIPNNSLMCIKVTSTKWMANYLYQTGEFAPLQTLALGTDGSPFIIAYAWSASGFGIKFTNPATLPTNTGKGVAFSPAADAIAVGHVSSPFIIAYPWSASGFGTKFTNPATLPTGNGNGVAFNPAGDAIAVAQNASPFTSAYVWSSATGFGTKFTDPATLPTGLGNGVAFSPAGDAIAVGHSTSPFITAYPFSASGFGTKFTNPATLPTGNGNGVAFNPAGDAIAVAHVISPRVTAYPWSSATGFGTKFTDPATVPPNTCFSVAFSPAGDAIAVAHDNAPFITAYPFSASGFGTKFTDPATLPTGLGRGVAFSPAADAIAVGHSISPFITAYPWSSATGFGIKYTNPATLPIAYVEGLAFTLNP